MRRFRTWKLADAETMDRIRSSDPRPGVLAALRAVSMPVVFTAPLLACNPKSGFDDKAPGRDTAEDTDPADDTDTPCELSPPADGDADGLDDIDEGTAGTDVAIPDSDGDGLLDGVEYWLLNTDPLDPLDPVELPPHEDLDADGLDETLERLLHTDPGQPDTDGDGLGDGDEWNNQSSDPLMRDTDGDGADDRQEAIAGTSSYNRCETPGVDPPDTDPPDTDGG